MRLSVHPYFLEFIRPFALAHGTRKGTDLVFVKIEMDGIISYGEASLPPYRNENVKSVTNWVEKQQEKVFELLQSDPDNYRDLKHSSEIPFSQENPAASNAIQTALLNFELKKKNKKLTDLFPQKNHSPQLTLTITKNDFQYLEEKLQLAKNFSCLKIKLTGSDDDWEFVKALRLKTEMPFCIDINQGYSKKENAIHLIEKLEPLNCILIEQPLKDKDHEGHYWLKQRTKLPIIADESICFYEDLVQFNEAYSGVNVKLMKCGGLFQAQKMLDYAEEKKMMKLIGCMSESSLGVSTAAVLTSQCRMADLDAPYLNKNDPFEGFRIVNEKIEIIGEINLKKEIKL